MTRHRLVMAVLVATALGALAVSGGAGERTQSPRACSGYGSIDVKGDGLDVSVTDPAGRNAHLDNSGQLTCDIPGCEALMGTRADDVDDSTGGAWWTDDWNFNFTQIVQGRYTIRVTAPVDDSAALYVSRSSVSGKGGDAEDGVSLRGGQTATWTLDWGCRSGSDSTWCILKRSNHATPPSRR
jgi:hypothetical protein